MVETTTVYYTGQTGFMDGTQLFSLICDALYSMVPLLEGKLKVYSYL